MNTLRNSHQRAPTTRPCLPFDACEADLLPPMSPANHSPIPRCDEALGCSFTPCFTPRYPCTPAARSHARSSLFGRHSESLSIARYLVFKMGSSFSAGSNSTLFPHTCNVPLMHRRCLPSASLPRSPSSVAFPCDFAGDGGGSEETSGACDSSNGSVRTATDSSRRK
jgi:hypothetical protein